MLFKGTARHYCKFRPEYPDALFALLVNRFRLGVADRVIDLGCGTGQLAISLAAFAGHVVAIDPEPEMLAVGRRCAKRLQRKNITWLEGSSWALDSGIGPVSLTTMGASFHWMDRDVVLMQVFEWTQNRGGIAIVGQELPLPDAVMPVVSSYLGPDRRAGTGVYTHPSVRHEEILRRSPFSSLEEWATHYERTIDADEIIGYIYSTSFGSKRLFGRRAAAFERDLRRELEATLPSGTFNQRVGVSAILAFKAEP